MIRENNGRKGAPDDAPGKSSDASEHLGNTDRQTTPGSPREPLPEQQTDGDATGTGKQQTPGQYETAWSAAQFDADDLNLADLDKVDWGSAGAADSDADGAQAPYEGDVITRDVHLAAVEAETAELRDQLLRAVAEAENIRKRAVREVADARKFAVTAFVKDIVPLTDNFQRVMEAVPADAIASDPALKSLLEGVEMTDRQFLGVLEKHGVKRIIPEGELFDPHFHQAIAQLPNPDLPAGTITDVAQPGFVLGERVLRPAMVVVAQGGPKPVKPAQNAAAEAGDGDGGPATGSDDGGSRRSAHASGGFGRRDASAAGSGGNDDGEPHDE